MIRQPVGDHDELLQGEILRAQVAIDTKLGQLGVGNEVGEAVADGLATLAKALGTDAAQAPANLETGDTGTSDPATAAPVAGARHRRDRGRAGHHHHLHAVVAGRDGVRVGADLVGHVAVGGHAVAADETQQLQQQV